MVEEKTEQHPLIKQIAEFCKKLGVKVQQIQQISLGEESKPTYYWVVAIPDKPPFAFKDIGDVATALSLLLTYTEQKPITFVEKGVQIIEKKVAEISGESETLEEVASETQDEEPPAFTPTAFKLDTPPPPAEPQQLAGMGGSQFEQRQRARAMASTRPSLMKTQSSNGAKAPVVVGSKTLV
jgi:hypothetical protein